MSACGAGIFWQITMHFLAYFIESTLFFFFNTTSVMSSAELYFLFSSIYKETLWLSSSNVAKCASLARIAVR